MQLQSKQHTDTSNTQLLSASNPVWLEMNFIILQNQINVVDQYHRPAAGTERLVGMELPLLSKTQRQK